MFKDKPKATITLVATLNGQDVGVIPSQFTVHDGDELRVDFPVVLAGIVEPSGPGTALIVREVIKPVVEE